MRWLHPMAMLLPAVIGAGCGGPITNDREAEVAFLGLEQMVCKSMDLGFEAYNLAKSANIDPLSVEGDLAGLLTIDGKVDQGNSKNKNMNLELALEEYSDGAVEASDGRDFEVHYDTEDGSLPLLELQLRGLPEGQVSGVLSGAFVMAGDLDGEVDVEMVLDGGFFTTDDDQLSLEPGSVTATGVASSRYGDFEVDVTF